MITEEEELEIYNMGLDYASLYEGEGSHPNPQGYSERQIGMFHGFSDGYVKAKETLYTKDDVIFAIQEAYGHGRDEADDNLHEQVGESIRVILKCLDEKKTK
jgi:hypothetical protein